MHLKLFIPYPSKLAVFDIIEMTETSLDKIDVGSKCRVVHLEPSASRRRLLEMGLVPGAEVEIIKKAPLGDPIEFKVKGYHLTLRKKDACRIIVKKS